MLELEHITYQPQTGRKKVLDDINIKKFTDVISEYSKSTQFIMVTHNKLTMESADCIYGVTAEKKGISKLMSIDFS